MYVIGELKPLESIPLFNVPTPAPVTPSVVCLRKRHADSEPLDIDINRSGLWSRHPPIEALPLDLVKLISPG